MKPSAELPPVTPLKRTEESVHFTSIILDPLYLKFALVHGLTWVFACLPAPVRGDLARE